MLSLFFNVSSNSSSVVVAAAAGVSPPLAVIPLVDLGYGETVSFML